MGVAFAKHQAPRHRLQLRRLLHPAPRQSPGAQALCCYSEGNGNISRNPLGSGNNPYTYTTGTVVTLTAQPATGQTFTGWIVDQAYAGWANPLTLTMDNNHNVTAQFAPTKTFSADVPNGANFEAITELASRATSSATTAPTTARTTGCSGRRWPSSSPAPRPTAPARRPTAR
ncbi:MAG: hypothetical protein U0841_28910 [Chloroflexia bacterium]